MTHSRLTPNYPVEIVVTVVNGGDTPGSYTVILKINGEVEQTQSVSVTGHSATPVKFYVYRTQPGTYTVTVDNQQATFTIIGSTSGTAVGGWSLRMGGIVALVVLAITILAGVIVLFTRRV